MKISRIALTIIALALILVAFAAGRLTTLAQVSGVSGSVSPTSSVSLPPTNLEPVEVEGEDVPDLPRFPGSTRVEFRRTLHTDVMVTESEYVVDGETTEIRDFFRDFFETNGWTMTDIDFSANEWTIVAVAGEREVVLEIESRSTRTEYEVEVTEPNASRPQGMGTTATVDEPTVPEGSATSEPTEVNAASTVVPTQPVPTTQPAPPVQPTATAQPPANPPAPALPTPPPTDDDGADDQDAGNDEAEDQDAGDDG